MFHVLVASLDQQPDVCIHEANGHRHVLSVGKDGLTVSTTLLDEAENIVPSVPWIRTTPK